MSKVSSMLRDPVFLEAGIAAPCRYDGGVTVIEEGAEERRIYLVQSGCVRVFERIELHDQRQIRPGICDLGEGEVFGELSLYESGPRLATVVTVVPTEVLVFDAAALVDYLDGNPLFGYELLRELFAVVTCRLRQTDRRLGSLFAWGLKAHGIDQHL